MPYSTEYSCNHSTKNQEDNNPKHKCSAGYVPEDDSCPVHPLWHAAIKRELAKEVTWMDELE